MENKTWKLNLENEPFTIVEVESHIFSAKIKVDGKVVGEKKFGKEEG